MASLAPEIAVRKLLINAAAVTAIVSAARVMCTWIQQSQALPAITITRISGRRDHHVTGATGLVEARLQIDHWSEDYDECLALSNATRLALDSYRGTVTQGSDSTSIRELHLMDDNIQTTQRSDASDTQYHRVRHDYQMWFTEVAATP